MNVIHPPGDASRAQRLLSERELPRPRPPGFGEVFGKGSLVPTPTEEHALYLHALAGELARSLEAIDGVVGARVHLGLPRPDPFLPGNRIPPRVMTEESAGKVQADVVTGDRLSISQLDAALLEIDALREKLRGQSPNVQHGSTEGVCARSREETNGCVRYDNGGRLGHEPAVDLVS